MYVNKNFCKIIIEETFSLIGLASARSMGARLVSARAPIKNTINIGINGITYQVCVWSSIITVIFKLPVKSITSKIAELNINS